jgi:hypothetical protein
MKAAKKPNFHSSLSPYSIGYLRDEKNAIISSEIPLE